MNKLRSVVKFHRIASSLLFIGFLCGALGAGRLLGAQSNPGPTANSEESLLADFRRVEVASVSDALEQLTGKQISVDPSLPNNERILAIEKLRLDLTSEKQPATTPAVEQ